VTVSASSTGEDASHEKTKEGRCVNWKRADPVAQQGRGDVVSPAYTVNVLTLTYLGNLNDAFTLFAGIRSFLNAPSVRLKEESKKFLTYKYRIK